MKKLAIFPQGHGKHFRNVHPAYRVAYQESRTLLGT